ncbi:MAG: serine hydrolase family protein [Salinarimonas sp.]|nr:serine hydrolase family protein [Salinarimonas sp.]
MKTSQADILILPGLKGPDGDLWLTRWERKLATARIVAQEDWHAPRADDWAARIGDAVAQAKRPVILVAHGIGCHAVAHAVGKEADLRRVAGAYLVAPPDPEAGNALPAHRDFGPPARVTLPFPAVVIGAGNDPHCPPGRARAFAQAWGAQFVDAGESGAIDSAAGFGPWPEGLMRFAGFLKTLPGVQ